MDITPAGPVLGAVIRDVDLARLNANEIDTVRRALADHEVLIFPDQDISSTDQMAFGRHFGELTVSPFSPNADDAPELIVLDNHPDSRAPLTDIWHSDETFRESPPLATVLHARIVPEFGGDTMFASMTAAYEGLSERFKHLLIGLTALHGFGRFGEMLRDDADRRPLLHRVENELGMAHHPVVRLHPETGRKAIFVNRHFTLKIDQLPESESRALLDYLLTLPLVPEYQLRVSWAPNMVVMWDNRSVQHYAPNDYLPHRRRMERITIKGDRPLSDTNQPAEDESARGTTARNVGRSLGEEKVTGNAPTRQFDRAT